MKELKVKIGVIGKIRSGKDTVAEILKEQLKEYNGSPTKLVQFSSGIKDTIITVFGEEIFKGGKPRKLYQSVGQFFRGIDGDVWVNKLMDELEPAGQMSLFPENVIVKDVRQPNEAKRLKEEGYALIKVEAPEEDRIRRADEEKDDFRLLDLHHETERAVDRCIYDYSIDNSGDLNNLEDEVEAVFNQIIEGVEVN